VTVKPGATVELAEETPYRWRIERHGAMRAPGVIFATLALPPGHEHLPADLRPVGQPVLVPGSMGAGSHVLTGVRGAPAFASACHGAGRRLSRHQAVKTTTAARLRAELEASGIAVRGASARGLIEETPQAYKDVDAVVEACRRAGLARKVAKLTPIGVVKG
jgi:tRNA-splicing ligase RtcB